jgi:membrane-associated protein
MSTLSDAILTLPAWAALLLVFGLPALEASAFVGFVFPGEIAVILGGVVASEGELPIAAVMAAASGGAIIGDSIGYGIGHRYGRGLLTRMSRFIKPDHVERGVEILNRLGGRAVFVGRFTAALRVLVPGLCGIARMRYRTFLTWNVIGGVAWACGSALLGFYAGKGYHRVERQISYASYIFLGVLVVAAVVWFVVRRHRRKKQSRLDVTTADNVEEAREPRP